MASRILPLALAVFLGSACRSNSFQRPPLPPQDVEVSRPELVRIYVLRDGQLRGRIRSIRVLDGDDEIGVMGHDQYLCWERPAGRTLLSFIYEGPRTNRGDLEGLFSLDSQAGRAYFLGIHLERNPDDPQLATEVGHPEVSVIDAAQGRALLRDREPVPVRD